MAVTLLPGSRPKIIGAHLGDGGHNVDAPINGQFHFIIHHAGIAETTLPQNMFLALVSILFS